VRDAATESYLTLVSRYKLDVIVASNDENQVQVTKTAEKYFDERCWFFLFPILVLKMLTLYALASLHSVFCAPLECAWKVSLRLSSSQCSAMHLSSRQVGFEASTSQHTRHWSKIHKPNFKQDMCDHCSKNHKPNFKQDVYADVCNE
jgi:hypothetical protein